jgi:hypothetical protein|tara:strand:- start:66 stop:272 length:207 start_codon:yes stop_codon:yes gene_type:complete
MKLDFKKNIAASVYIDNTKLIDSDESRVFGKVDEDKGELYIYVKNPKSGRSIKMVFRTYVEEVENEDI